MLGAVSWTAGVVAILAFLGYSANFTVKVAVGATLSLIAFAAAVSTLIPAIRLWRSPRGAFYRGRDHGLRIARAIGSLVLAAVVIVAVVQAVVGHSTSLSNGGSPKVHSTPK